MSQADRKRECRAEVLEALAELYLRLNGYFCIRNYLYHLEKGAKGLRTESDLLAVRMPHQQEILVDQTVQKNDPALILPIGNDRVDCLIAEVKEPSVEFNKPLLKTDGWMLIKSAIQMFGVLSPTEFDPGGKGTAIAKDLHGQICGQVWPEIPIADDGDKNRLCVRMPVFSLDSAKHAKSRKFITLEHSLDFVCMRMRPGQVCSPYSRGPEPAYSPWRGTTRQIVDFLEQVYKTGQIATVGELLHSICGRMMNQTDGVRTTATLDAMEI